MIYALTDHRNLGAELKRLRSSLFENLKTAKKGSPKHRHTRKALKALDQLRCQLDELIFDDYYSELGRGCSKVYYGSQVEDVN